MSVAVGGFKRRAPKTAQGRRVAKREAPKVFENPKSILFLRGASTSEVINDALNDLFAVTRPYSKKLRKRNAFHPFEGREHLEFLGHKNDCPLFCFGSDSKKRPHNLVIGRLYDHHVLDMAEFGVVAMDRLEMGDTKGQSVGSLGGKALLVFEGSEFEHDPTLQRLKTLLMDFFRGGNDTEINLEGVDRVVFVSLRSDNGEDAVVAPSADCVGSKPPAVKGNAVVCLRHYALVSKAGAVVASGGGVATAAAAAAAPGANRAAALAAARAELVDIGPNFDLEVRRLAFAPANDYRQACRVPREALAHLRSTQENVTGDALGNLRGQLHVGRQDVTQLNLRRFKAHRKAPRSGEEGAAAPAAAEHEGEALDADRPSKRRRRAKRDVDSTLPETDI